MTETDREALETQRIRQELRHNRIKLYVSVIGAALVLLGLLADRIKTHEQQRHEFELAQFNQKLVRMTTIAEEYDRLFGQTTAVLDRNRSRTWQLINLIGSLNQELRDAKLRDPEVIRLQRYVHDVYSKLADSSIAVDEWADALAAEARWSAASRSLTPDLEHHFGGDLLEPWRKLRESAIAALQAEYSIRGTHPKEKTDRFRELGSAFQTQVYARLADARAKR